MYRVLIAVIALVQAEQVRADAWDRLLGQWTGHGKVNGMQAEVVFQFFKTLDGRGRHLRFENAMAAKDGTKSLFQADGYYMCDDRARTCHGHRYDSRGVVLPLTVATTRGSTHRAVGRRDDGTWPDHLRVTPGCCLEVTDEVRGKDGVLRVFGRTVSRQSGGAAYTLDTATCVATPAVPAGQADD